MDKLSKEQSSLPPGTIVCRTIRGKKRFYHQWRANGKTLSRYLKAEDVLPLRLKIERRKNLERLRAGSIPAQDTSTSGSVPAQDSSIIAEKQLNEVAITSNKQKRRRPFEDILSFLRNDQPSRILIIKGPVGSGKTTLIRQVIGALTPQERADLTFLTTPSQWGSVPARTVDLTEMRYAEFVRLFPNLTLTDFLQRGGLPSDVYTDPDATFEYLESQIGDGAWATLATLTIDFLIQAIRPRSGRFHGRNRTFSDFQKIYQHLTRLRETPDPSLLLKLHQMGFLRRITTETLRPEFSRREETIFVHPGLRHILASTFIFNLLEEASFASLGAAERKLVRDWMLSDSQEHAMEECVAREINDHFKSGPRTSVTVRLPSGRLSFVIANREELACEMFVVRNADSRRDEQLEDISDYRVLDAIEHRYGLITERTILYRGRNARHPTGIAYRNIEKFLTDL